MSQVSRFKLDNKVFEKIFQLFFEIFKSNSSKESFLLLLDDLLTPTEKIVLAKRIALIYLKQRGVPTVEIGKILHVSTSTVVHWSLILNNSNSVLLKTLSKISFQIGIGSLIEDLLTDLLLQPGIKKGHWNLYWQRERDKKQEKIWG